jgi:D-alanyl-D-alanine carboxypeptidase/D-alanyl-D-alanine carboxypeptidase (penicillin-binding protein 5/6)
MKFIKRVLLLIFAVFLLDFKTYAYALEDNSISVSAKSYVLIESKTGRIISEKNSDKKLAMASTTKIMSAILCLESGNLDKEFEVDSEAIKVEGSSMGLVEGEIVTKRDLCVGMLLPSGNDAANATAVAVGGSIENFVAMMNEKAKEIGLEKTHFVTPSGLDANGHGSTAYDMALLASYALENEDFAQICQSEQITLKTTLDNSVNTKVLTNSNKLLSMYEGVTGVKTGFTDEAGRCLVSSCERNGVTLICVTLNAPDDWNDHINLYEYGFSVAEKTIVSTEEKEISVVGSDKEKITSVAENEFFYGKIAGDENDIEVVYETKPFLFADVKSGDIVGNVKYYYSGKEIFSDNLIATENAEYISENSNQNIFERLLLKIGSVF